MTEMFTPPEHISKKLLRSYLRSANSHTGRKATYTYHKSDITDIPDGYYAVVSVEIKPLNGNPLYEAPPWSEEAVYD